MQNKEQELLKVRNNKAAKVKFHENRMDAFEGYLNSGNFNIPFSEWVKKKGLNPKLAFDSEMLNCGGSCADGCDNSADGEIMSCADGELEARDTFDNLIDQWDNACGEFESADDELHAERMMSADGDDEYENASAKRTARKEKRAVKKDAKAEVRAVKKDARQVKQATKKEIKKTQGGAAYRAQKKDIKADKRATINTAKDIKKDTVKEAKVVKREAIKAAGGTTLGKAAKVVKKVGLSPVRNAFLSLLKLNVFWLARRFSQIKEKRPSEYAKLLAKWKSFGGNTDVLEKQVSIGKDKKPPLVGKKGMDKKETTNSASGKNDYAIGEYGYVDTSTYYNAVGETVAGIIAAAGTFMAAIAPILKSNKDIASEDPQNPDTNIPDGKEQANQTIDDLDVPDDVKAKMKADIASGKTLDDVLVENGIAPDSESNNKMLYWGLGILGVGIITFVSIKLFSKKNKK